jgi:hypothetical protein
VTRAVDVQTEDWGVVVTLVELKDIQLPDTMQRAMAATAPASSPPPAVELPATDTGVNTDYNGAPAARPH